MKTMNFSGPNMNIGNVKGEAKQGDRHGLYRFHIAEPHNQFPKLPDQDYLEVV